MGLLITGSLAIGTLADAPDGSLRLAAGMDILDLALHAGLVVQLVLVGLLGLSVFSWAVIAFKWRELRGAEQDSEAFLEVYRVEGFDSADQVAGDLSRSPLSELFLEGVAEVERRSQSPEKGGEGLDAGDLRRVVRRLSWAGAQEVHRLESGLSFLATVGNAAPFIGLFGTVVGIITAFQGIAATGSASLAVVAPGIAEALVATAAGLLAAIPASIFFNHFVTRAGEIGVSVELFVAELEEDLLSRQAKTRESGAS